MQSFTFILGFALIGTTLAHGHATSYYKRSDHHGHHTEINHGGHDGGHGGHDGGHGGHEASHGGHEAAHGGHEASHGGFGYENGHEEGHGGHEISYGGHETSYGGHEGGHGGHEISYGGLEASHGEHDGGHGGSEASHGGHESGHGHSEYHDYYHHPSYKFEYGVDDPKTKDHHSQWEHRDGDKVHGEYNLVEADGSKRTVKYSSDKKGGFTAHVEHAGYHSHPQDYATHKEEHHEEGHH